MNKQKKTKKENEKKKKKHENTSRKRKINSLKCQRNIKKKYNKESGSYGTRQWGKYTKGFG